MFGPNDCACSKSELALFEPRPVQVVLEQGSWIDFHPLNSLGSGNGPIEFNIAGSSDSYLDLNDTVLSITAKVVKAGGDDLETEDDVSPSNCWMQSLFSDVSLTLGDRQIEGGNQMNPFRSYFNTQLIFSKASKETHIQSQGYYKDQAGKMNNASNEGYIKRKAWVAGSKPFTMVGPLYLDLFQQSKYLINHLDMKIKLQRTKPEFSMLALGTDKPNVEIRITDATLYVRRVNVLPSIMLDHEEVLRTKNAIYPVQHTEMVTYTIPSGSMSHTKENLFRGMLPKFLVFGMVTNTAYNGSYSENCFNFQHFNVNQIALYREGECVPFRPMNPNFGTNKDAMREYIHLYQSLEMFNKDDSIGLTYEEFCEGSTLFAFNLTPDLTMAGHAQVPRSGNLRLDLKFAQALSSSINIVMLAIFDGRVEITRARDVLVDYRS
jgi:hypothetical protein